MPRSHYDVLQLDSQKASHDEIKRAFRRLSMELHPDKNGNSEESKRAFQELNEAYNVLSDPEKRGNYDFELQMGIGGHRVHRMGPMGMGPMGMGPMGMGPMGMGPMGMGPMGMGPMGMGINPVDMLFAAMHQHQHQNQQPQNPAQHIFEAMFGGNGMGMGPKIIIHNFTTSSNDGSNDGSHASCEESVDCDHIEMIVISLEDAYNGFTQRPITVSYDDENYNKQTDIVLIDVPPRVANGHKIHVPGKNHGRRCAITIQINIAEHPLFIREGEDDLVVEHRVSLKDALCGFTFELVHLNGRSYKFNCKSCSITGSMHETKVLPGLGYNETGALKIRFSIDLPTSLTQEQIVALSNIL
jgi:DnaJ-class molecular chaperone